MQIRRDDAAAASTSYARALELAPNGPLLHKLYQAQIQIGDADRALATLDDWIAAHPDDFGIKFVRATHLAKHGRLAEAQATYEALATANPDNHVIANNLALVYDELDDPRAVETAERAYAGSSGSPLVADTLGWILARRGDPARAVQLLQDAAQRLPDEPSVHYHLAYAHHAAGAPAAAKVLLRALLEQTPDFAEADEAKALLQRLEP